jgi:hypothetical protein
MVKPGPISKERLENKARLGVCLELMFETREERRDMPSVPVTAVVEAVVEGVSVSDGSR